MADSQAFNSLLTDELLVHVRQGSHDAWREVYRRYRPFLSIAAKGVCGARPQDVDDVLQSAFLSAWSEIKGFSYEGKNSFRAWLRGIVINKNLSELRKRSRRAQMRDQNHMGTEFMSTVTAADSHGPSESVERQDAQERVLQVIEQELDEIDREIVILKYFEMLNSTQIAGIVELDPRTVRKRYGAAMQKLAQHLSEGGEP